VNLEEQRTLNLFELVESRPSFNQRQLAQELDISLGLANAYLRTVLNKGWIRARQVKARRWLYFLTPQGALEKSRLSLSYLHRTLDSFRELRCKADAMLAELVEEGVTGVHLLGEGDWADIVQLCLPAHGIRCLSVIPLPDSKDGASLGLIAEQLPLLKPQERFLVTSLDHQEEAICQLRNQSYGGRWHRDSSTREISFKSDHPVSSEPNKLWY